MTNHRIRFLGSIAVMSIGIIGCGPSNRPAVAVAPVETLDLKPDQESNDQPARKAKDRPLASGSSFSFPDDAGGKALARSVTPPAPPAMPVAVPIAPKMRKLPGFLDTPAPPSFDAANSPPRLPLPEAKPARPTALPDRVPPDLGGVYPELPARSEFATGPLARTETRNANAPLDLPPLAQRPIADRAPLTDPTIDFTAQSVINQNLPLRTQPTGFLRINLPDPFENVEAAKPRTPLIENPNRSLGIPPPPR